MTTISKIERDGVPLFLALACGAFFGFGAYIWVDALRALFIGMGSFVLAAIGMAIFLTIQKASDSASAD